MYEFDVTTFGSVFALLTFWHFVADWLFQNHTEAMAKAKDRDVRAWHCLKYGIAFVPVLIGLPLLDNLGLATLSMFDLFAVTIFLVLTHYIIDSYVPVMLWAKHLRKAPQFAQVGPTVLRGWEDKKLEGPRYATDEEAFKAFVSTPLGLILAIVMDQFMHIACLLVVAWSLVPCEPV